MGTDRDLTTGEVSRLRRREGKRKDKEEHIITRTQWGKKIGQKWKWKNIYERKKKEKKDI